MDDFKLSKFCLDRDFVRNFFKNNLNILKAYDFARKAHFNQTRNSGLPFIVHPLAVAMKLWNKYEDETLAIAGFLHDTVEDVKSVSIKDIYDNFGDEVGFIVDSLNKYEDSFYFLNDFSFEEKIDRLLFAGVLDFRIFLVKIADRVHNLETLEDLKENKQVRMAFETQAIFEPLKNVLGFDEDLNLEEVEKRLNVFLEENKILKKDFLSIKKLKKYLYSKSFDKLDDSSFLFVYNNSSNVIWRVESLSMFKRLCKLDSLKNKIDLVCMSSNGRWIHIDFRFLKGLVSNNKNDLKMKISSFKT